jgi:hypothetical protein
LICLVYSLVIDTLYLKGTPLLASFIDSDWLDEPDVKNLLHVMFSTLVKDLALGLVRNNSIFIFVYHKQSIE